jgi:hypothetical protein
MAMFTGSNRPRIAQPSAVADSVAASAHAYPAMRALYRTAAVKNR